MRTRTPETTGDLGQLEINLKLGMRHNVTWVLVDGKSEKQILDQTLRLEPPSVETELRLAGRFPATWGECSVLEPEVSNRSYGWGW